MRLTGGWIFDPEWGFVQRDLGFSDGVINSAAGGESMDISGCYVIPGLTDLHFHGCMGADLSDGDAKGLKKMADYQASRGVTQICPAGMSLLPVDLEKYCTVAAEHRRTAKSGAELVGLNLEGPFLSMEKKGAQNGDWLINPDLQLLDRLIEISGGLAKLVTVAPELPGAMEFIAGASGKIVVSLGHTSADYDIAIKAFECGARQVTHLFNAMPSLNHRSPGLVAAAADSDGVMAELISDGVHVHPAMVRAAFKLFGADRIILISDTMRAAGMPEGEYTLGGQKVIVKGSRPVLTDGTIAGSNTDLMSCLQRAVSFGIPLFDAVKAAAVNPAKVLGIYDKYGSLEEGKSANLTVFDKNLNLQRVYCKGETQNILQ